MQKLSIKAAETTECDVISCLLQDSIFHFSSLTLHDDQKCLRLMANRFCWELLEKEPHYYRVHSGLYIYNIENIIINDNFKRMKEDKYLSLLAMHAAENEITMLFSGDKTAVVKTNKICVYLKDLHDQYATPVIPVHEGHV